MKINDAVTATLDEIARTTQAKRKVAKLSLRSRAYMEVFTLSCFPTADARSAEEAEHAAEVAAVLKEINLHEEASRAAEHVRQAMSLVARLSIHAAEYADDGPPAWRDVSTALTFAERELTAAAADWKPAAVPAPKARRHHRGDVHEWVRSLAMVWRTAGLTPSGDREALFTQFVIKLHAKVSGGHGRGLTPRMVAYALDLDKDPHKNAT